MNLGSDVLTRRLTYPDSFHGYLSRSVRTHQHADGGFEPGYCVTISRYGLTSSTDHAAMLTASSHKPGKSESYPNCSSSWQSVKATWPHSRTYRFHPARYILSAHSQHSPFRALRTCELLGLFIIADKGWRKEEESDKPWSFSFKSQLHSSIRESRL